MVVRKTKAWVEPLKDQSPEAKRTNTRPQVPAVKEKAAQIVKRTNNGRFKKGSSGAHYLRLNNESHTAYIRRLAREKGPEMVKVLAQIAGDNRRNDSARVKAASILLDRAYGKATQVIETVKGESALHEIPTEDLVKLLQESQEKKREARRKSKENLNKGELPAPEIVAADGKDA